MQALHTKKPPPRKRLTVCRLSLAPAPPSIGDRLALSGWGVSEWVTSAFSHIVRRPHWLEITKRVDYAGSRLAFGNKISDRYRVINVPVAIIMPAHPLLEIYLYSVSKHGWRISELFVCPFGLFVPGLQANP